MYFCNVVVPKAFFILIFSGLLVVSGAFAADLSGFASDDFNSTTLDTAIWTFIDPKGDSTVDVNGAHLVIMLPAGSNHDVWTAGNDAPRVMQSINNTDFELEIKFETPVNQQVQIQGMLIEQDAGNLIRFDFHNNGTNTQIFAATFTNGNPVTRIDSTISTGAPLYMRINRVGDQWTQSFSVDGVIWNSAGTFSHALVVNSAGAFAGNFSASGSGAPAHTAVIDYFFRTASPIIPEDGVTIPDTTPPFIHNIERLVELNQVQFTWSTDEVASAVVEYGLTTGYELGMVEHADFTFTHDLAVTGLASNTTYNFRVRSTDPGGNESLSSNIQLITSPFPVINAWYGSLQDFGQLGSNSARWVNILGNVSGQNPISTLSYSLNGQASQALTLGPDTRRLQDAGDFNVEIEYLELLDGLNNVTITATDILGNTTTENVTVNYASGNTWPLPYTADWTTTSQIGDLAQIVDGVWALQSDGVRTAQLGYDRLLSIGDISWDNYEVTVPITLHGLDPDCSIDLASDPCRGGPGVGVLVRWQGHHPTGVQPSWEWRPLGALGWYRWRLNPSTGITTPALYLTGGDGATIVSDPGKAFPVGSTYLFKVRAETVGGQHEYKIKMWEQGQPEPAQWDLSGTQALAQSFANGSLLLVAHYTDTTFGNVIVVSDTTPPVITTQPESATVNAGGSVTFTVAATGTGTLSYQWQKGGMNIGGATSASHTIPAAAAVDAGSYQVVVTNTVNSVANSVTSNAATLTVNVAPGIDMQPDNQSVVEGSPAAFSVGVSGTTPFTYQWRRGGVDISGATSASYTIPSTSLFDNGAVFSVVVTNVVTSVTSAEATLSVAPAPVTVAIATNPVDQTVDEGATATFSVAVSGTPPFTYQWRKNGVDIMEATGASYITAATTPADNGASYQVVVTNVVNTVTSAAATLTVNLAPTIGTQPVDQAVAAAATASFSVVASGAAPLTYQWQKDGVDIAGATSADYTTPATTVADDGSTYQVVVSNAVSSVTSSAATLTIDSNGDGLSDADAIALGLDPNAAGGDSDGDGASDVAEVGGDVNNPLDTDADGVIDALEPGAYFNNASIASGLKLPGGVTVSVTSAGQTLSAVSTADASGAPTGISFPLGTLSYTTTVTAPGDSVTVRMAISSDLPASIDLYKVDNVGVYTLLPDTIWTRVDVRTIDITLTDGDPQTDLDGAADGSIVDPVAIAIADTTPPPAPISSGGGGGGCQLIASADSDPSLPLLMLISLSCLFRRRFSRAADQA